MGTVIWIEIEDVRYRQKQTNNVCKISVSHDDFVRPFLLFRRVQRRLLLDSPEGVEVLPPVGVGKGPAIRRGLATRKTSK